MTSPNEQPVTFSGDISFESIVGETCDRLHEKHIQYSISRLQQMEEMICRLEEELDAFLGNR